jgi:MFS family permease
MSGGRVVALVTWAIILAGASVIPGFLAGAVVPFARLEFPVSDAAVGAAFSGFWLVGAIAATPFARLTGRIGVIPTLRLAGVVLILTSTATALLVHNEVALVVFITLSGFAPALAVPASNIVIMSVVPPRHQAFALTSSSASSAIGLMGAGFVVSALAEQLGWNVMYLLCAAFGLVLLVAGLLLRASVPAPLPRPKGDVARLAGRGTLTLVLVGACMANIATGAAAVFLVSAAPSAGVHVEAAALAAAIAAAVSIAARVALGLIVDRVGTDPLPIVACLIGAGGIGYLLLAIGQPWTFLVGIGLVLIPGWIWVNLLLYGVLARYRHDVTTATGMAQTTFFVGSVIGPAAVGGLIVVTSFSISWLVLAVAVVLGATVIAFLGPRLPSFDLGRPKRTTAADTLRQP